MSDLDQRTRAVDGVGASFNRDDNLWHFYTMPGTTPIGLTLKDDAGDPTRVNWIIGLLRAGLVAASTDSLRETLRDCDFWLTGALECKDWSWDADQHEAATDTRDRLRALLEPIKSVAQPGRHP